MKENQNEKKKKHRTPLLSLLFGGKDTYDILEEEQIMGPWKTVLHNFMENKAAMASFIIFVCMFLFVLIGPRFFPLDLSYQESSQMDMAPGMNLMKIPDALKGHIEAIAVGPKFSVGSSTDGQLYVWGQTKISNSIDISNIPQIDGKVVQLSAGVDHMLALTEDGQVYAWGNDRLQQCTLPNDLYKHGNIVQILAGYQISAAVTDTGYVHFWGNKNLNDVRVKKAQQGTIQKIALTSDAMIGLTFDGEVLYLGKNDTPYAKIPENVSSVKAVDIAAGANTVAAVLEDGSVTVWGTISNDIDKVPAVSGKVIHLDAGRYHYVGVTDNGEIISWGQNIFKQTNVPKSLNASNIRDIYVGYYQNYAVMNDGTAVTWGLKGYVMGTDYLGRDNLTRIVNGGLMTMTIGAVSVIIATFIGIIIGCISGFFGGKVDMFLMRVTEIFHAIPFLPFAMILSSLMVLKFGENFRIFIIMVVLGLLSWTGLAKLVRAQVLSQREQEFVVAAKAMGIKETAIVFRHILPNVISTIIVNATLSFATCLLTESNLSYLGFGVVRPRPTWGNMLYGANNSVTIQNYWWEWVFPALFLSMCVICINTIGDGLRDAIDPKSNDR